MPPKQAQNAFYFFMLDYRKREEANGRTFNNLNEVAPLAGDEWKEMSREERQPYEIKSKQAKGRRGPEKKYTTTGEDIAVRQRQEQEVERKKKEMIERIEDLVADGNDFVTKSFFVAHVNHYCYHSAYSKHIPAEISIVRFSLQDGVYLEDIYHVILDTGNMPIGYRLTALTIANESHQIPIPPHDEIVSNISEKNIHKAYLSMIDFLRKNLGSHEYLPPVYVDDSNMEISKNVFAHLHADFDGNNVYNEIPVYSLSYLFYVLRNAAHFKVSSDKAFPFPTIAENELSKDIYDFVKNIACKYHNSTEDAYPYCSLSKCIRLVFIICDHTCYDLDINLIPGRHVPENVKLEKLEHRPSSQISWTSIPNSRPPSSMSTSNGPRREAPSAAAVTNKFSQLQTNEEVETARKPTETPKWSNVPTFSYSNAAASRPSSTDHVRKPQSVSVARNFKPIQPPDLSNDFPALGASRGSGNRPPSVGRGRGRILQNIADKS